MQLTNSAVKLLTACNAVDCVGEEFSLYTWILNSWISVKLPLLLEHDFPVTCLRLELFPLLFIVRYDLAFSLKVLTRTLSVWGRLRF